VALSATGWEPFRQKITATTTTITMPSNRNKVPLLFPGFPEFEPMVGSGVDVFDEPFGLRAGFKFSVSILEFHFLHAGERQFHGEAAALAGGAVAIHLPPVCGADGFDN